MLERRLALRDYGVVDEGGVIHKDPLHTTQATARRKADAPAVSHQEIVGPAAAPAVVHRPRESANAPNSRPEQRGSGGSRPPWGAGGGLTEPVYNASAARVARLAERLGRERRQTREQHDAAARLALGVATEAASVGSVGGDLSSIVPSHAGSVAVVNVSLVDMMADIRSDTTSEVGGAPGPTTTQTTAHGQPTAPKATPQELLLRDAVLASAPLRRHLR